MGELQLNSSKRQVLLDGTELSLTGAEFGVLECLMENVGELVDKDTLSLAALGRRLMAYDRSIDMHVSNLRKKPGRRSDDSDWIKTVRSRGICDDCGYALVPLFFKVFLVLGGYLSGHVGGGDHQPLD